jgi:hypothetical protein
MWKKKVKVMVQVKALPQNLRYYSKICLLRPKTATIPAIWYLPHNSTNFKKSRSHVKILTKISVTGKQYHTNDSQISGTTLKKIGHLNNLMPGNSAPLVTSIT